MVDASKRRRMDFVQEVISIDESSGTIEVAFRPDPRRYEWREMGGNRYLFDRLDDIYFSEEGFFELLEQIAGKPCNFQPQEIE